MGNSSGISWLIFPPYKSSEPAIALTASPFVFVLIQFRIVFLPVESLSTDRAFKDVGRTARCPEAGASG